MGSLLRWEVAGGCIWRGRPADRHVFICFYVPPIIGGNLPYQPDDGSYPDPDGVIETQKVVAERFYRRKFLNG